MACQVGVVGLSSLYGGINRNDGRCNSDSGAYAEEEGVDGKELRAIDDDM